MKQDVLKYLAVWIACSIVAAGCTPDARTPEKQQASESGSSFENGVNERTTQTTDETPVPPTPGQRVTPGVPMMQREGSDVARRAQAVIQASPAARLQAPPGTASAAPDIAMLEPGVMAPDFVSQNIANDDVRLSDMSDRVVVLDFWATWCGPCLASLPHTQDVAQRCRDQGVVVLAVCTSDTREKFENWISENADKYPDIVFTCDPHDRGSDTFDERASRKLFGVRGIPAQFVIGPDGKIAAVLTGHSKDDHRLEDVLANLGVKLSVPDSSGDSQ